MPTEGLSSSSRNARILTAVRKGIYDQKCPVNMVPEVFGHIPTLGLPIRTSVSSK